MLISCDFVLLTSISRTKLVGPRELFQNLIFDSCFLPISRDLFSVSIWIEYYYGDIISLIVMFDGWFV